ncbi:GTPase-activating protein gyp8 [Marasmius tenuissimus]|uniref:GTPase-activating protein gyp8 n=1 Tax=Marasmius tenuissimus TaxID=585030 RepID=A0ABR3A369_9AGAR
MAKLPQKTKVDKDDWLELRKRSLLPGGFGEERKWIWPKLLFVEGSSSSRTASSDLSSATQERELKHEEHDDEYILKDSTNESRHTDEQDQEEHRDERQIQLDTDRSFVLYPDPVGEPKLSLSLCCTNSTPATTTEVKTDKEHLQEELRKLLVRMFRKRPKLHYFQGYHDIVTVFFLTLPSEIQLETYFGIAEARYHSYYELASTVIDLLISRFMKGLLKLADAEYAATLEESTPLPYFALSNLLTLFSHDMPTLPLIQHVFDYLLCRPPVMVVYLVTAITLTRKAEVQRLQEEGEDGMLHSVLASLPPLTDEEHFAPPSPGSRPHGEEKEVKQEQEDDDDPLLLSQDESKVDMDEYPPLEDDKPKPPRETSTTALVESDPIPPSSEESPTHPPPYKSSPSPPLVERGHQGDDQPRIAEKAPSASSSRSPSPPPPTKPSKTTIPLTDLLQMADFLYEEYPPDSPLFKHKLSDIMGPQSVMFTWSEVERELPSDDTAEKMVDYPELVVYPAIEDDDGDEDEKMEDWETDISESQKSGKRRNKLRKRRSPQDARKKLGKALELRDRKAMVAGAVLVLGVAMAVYGVRYGTLAPGDSRGHGHGFSREWKKIGGWVGSVLLGSRYW